MRVRLIVNPTATGVRGPVLDAVVAQLERVCELEVAETERAGHGLELAREMDSGAVVGMGGDGTANEVANGVQPGVIVGVLDSGLDYTHADFRTAANTSISPLAQAVEWQIRGPRRP